MNQVNLVGRMTRDAEPIGNPPVGVRFAIATEDYDFGTKQRETEFHEVKAFGKVQDVISQYGGKGHEVRVTGKIKTDTYTPTKGPNAGIEQKVKVVYLDDFELLAGKPKAAAGDGSSSGW